MAVKIKEIVIPNLNLFSNALGAAAQKIMPTPVIPVGTNPVQQQQPTGLTRVDGKITNESAREIPDIGRSLDRVARSLESIPDQNAKILSEAKEVLQRTNGGAKVPAGEIKISMDPSTGNLIGIFKQAILEDIKA